MQVSVLDLMERFRSRSPLRAPIGPRSRIIRVLHNYPEQMPISVVAEMVGQSRADVERYIAPFVADGIITRNGELIQLSE